MELLYLNHTLGFPQKLFLAIITIKVTSNYMYEVACVMWFSQYLQIMNSGDLRKLHHMKQIKMDFIYTTNVYSIELGMFITLYTKHRN